MLETERAKPNTELVFAPPGVALWYSLLAPAAVALMSLVVGYFCFFLIMDPDPVAGAMGILTLVLYVGYVCFYFYRFGASRKDVTRYAKLTDAGIEHKTKRESKFFAHKDIVFTMSYSSSTNLCIILATETDYMVLTCSCSFLFAKNGKEVIKPFYAMNAYYMNLNEAHINYIKNKKYRKKNPFVIPHFFFEIDYYSKKAQAFITKTKALYRFR
ncbi:MAG: hypothetical protein LBS18_06030 [Clostridiales bacterium]|jgi:Ca2+/Na+ antiporter|nr:hypothetical protein [Clostridiales bacterium]